jgi:hypothetical protein
MRRTLTFRNSYRQFPRRYRGCCARSSNSMRRNCTCPHRDSTGLTKESEIASFTGEPMPKCRHRGQALSRGAEVVPNWTCLKHWAGSRNDLAGLGMRGHPRGPWPSQSRISGSWSAGARNGARCPTDPSRSPRSSNPQKPLETVSHVAQRDLRFGLITRRSQVRILPPAIGRKPAYRAGFRVFGRSSKSVKKGAGASPGAR